jgi:hypothetical protein
MRDSGTAPRVSSKRAPASYRTEGSDYRASLSLRLPRQGEEAKSSAQRASRPLGDSLTVEQSALTRLVLVRIQVPQNPSLDLLPTSQRPAPKVPKGRDLSRRTDTTRLRNCGKICIKRAEAGNFLRRSSI